MQDHRWIEHFVELQLIEVMILQMLPIQFVSIVNWIQIKCIEVANDFLEKKMESTLSGDKNNWKNDSGTTGAPDLVTAMNDLMNNLMT
jgi:hypothetical protein